LTATEPKISSILFAACFWPSDELTRRIDRLLERRRKQAGYTRAFQDLALAASISSKRRILSLR
jgi:hypothetical protein